jgi:hypothetical protein
MINAPLLFIKIYNYNIFTIMNTENFTELKLHKFFLVFYDRKDKLDYQIKRNPEIVIISSLFLL